MKILTTYIAAFREAAGAGFEGVPAASRFMTFGHTVRYSLSTGLRTECVEAIGCHSSIGSLLPRRD